MVGELGLALLQHPVDLARVRVRGRGRGRDRVRVRASSRSPPAGELVSKCMRSLGLGVGLWR